MSSIFGEDFPIPKKNTWVEITILTYFNKIHNSQTLNLNMQGIEFIDLLSLDSQNVYILDVSPLTGDAIMESESVELWKPQA